MDTRLSPLILGRDSYPLPTHISSFDDRHSAITVLSNVLVLTDWLLSYLTTFVGYVARIAIR